MIRHTMLLLICLLHLMFIGACTHNIAVPEPVTINLNIKIDHEIRHKVDKDLEDVLSADSGLF